jgi:HAE1 family hydrophobic/amphiphilic exporter-1
LFPSEDTGFLNATTEAATDISIPALIELQTKVAAIVRADKAVDYINSSVGAGGINPTSNTGRISIALKPRAERGESATQVIQRLRVTANTVPGMSVIFTAVQNIPNLTGRASKAEFQYTLQSSDTEALYRLAPEMRERIAKVAGVRDVNSDLYIKNPQMGVEIDREKAAVYGVTVDQVRQEMFNAFGTRQVASIYTAIADYYVILESQPEFQTDTTALSRLYVKTASGMSVPLVV